MKWKIDQHGYCQLLHATGSAIQKALIVPTLHEPQLVANLAWHLPDTINSLKLSKGLSVKSGAVFVHAQPLVTSQSFPDKKPESVELGDLLLLRRNANGGNQRAMLLQAKKFQKLPATPGNQNQHHLYALWPFFEYTRSTEALNGQRRHIFGPDIYDAAKYLLIADGTQSGCAKFPTCLSIGCGCFMSCLSSYCLMTAHPSWPDLSHYRCFVTELVDFILGDAGKKFKAPYWNDKNWNKVIQDLTEITGARVSAYMRRASGCLAKDNRGNTQAFTRGSKDVFSFLIEDWDKNIDQSEIPPEVPDNRNSDGDDERGGISIISFVVSEKPG